MAVYNIIRNFTYFKKKSNTSKPSEILVVVLIIYPVSGGEKNVITLGSEHDWLNTMTKTLHGGLNRFPH